MRRCDRPTRQSLLGTSVMQDRRAGLASPAQQEQREDRHRKTKAGADRAIDGGSRTMLRGTVYRSAKNLNAALAGGC
jgi:hypothetical protein